MKILVTGGAGFIGTNLIKRLVKDGHQVMSLDDYSTGLVENEVEGAFYEECDIEDTAYFPLDKSFDLVYHLAARARIQPSFDQSKDYYRVNVKGTERIANECAFYGIPMIHAGTSSVHAGKDKNPYTYSKYIAEEVLQYYGRYNSLTFAVARFYNVYGPYQLIGGEYATLIGKWIHNIKHGEPCVIYGDGEQRRDFTHVDDIVAALIKMGETIDDFNGIMENRFYELGRGQSFSVNNVAQMFEIIPVYKEGRPGEARTTLADYSEAKSLLGWEPKINLPDYIYSLKSTLLL